MKRRTLLSLGAVGLSSGCLDLVQESDATRTSATRAEETSRSTDAPARSTTRAASTPTTPEPETESTTAAPETAQAREAGNHKWRFRARTTVSATPLVAGDTVYVGDGSARLYALERSYGREKWSVSLPDGDEILGRPAVVGGTLLVTTDEQVHALDPENGQQRWQTDAFGSTVRDSPLVANERVYAGSKVGTLRALDLDTGERRWEYNVNGTYPVEGAKGTIVDNGVAVDGDTAYVVSTDDREQESRSVWLHVLDAATGEQRDLHELPVERARLWGPLQAGDGVVVVTSRDADAQNWFGCVDATSGDALWTKRSDVSAEVTLRDGTVYAKARPGGETGLYAFDARTGRQQWRVEGGTCCVHTPIVDGNRVYVTDGRTLQVVDADSGSVAWTVEFDVGFASGVEVGSDAVYFGGEDGRAYGVWRQ